MDLKSKIILISGPTASGKSKAALKIAKKLNGEIITFSNDSMESEVYPVFINEAAYVEKNIAMGITAKEFWRFQEDWKNDLVNLFSE